MKLQLVTFLGTKFSDDVYEVMLPTASGPIAVLPQHEPMVTLVKDGIISVRRHKDDGENELDHYALTGGVAEISSDTVRVLVDAAEHSDEINESEATRALEMAQALKASAKDSFELDAATVLIARHTARLRVAGLRRHRR